MRPVEVVAQSTQQINSITRADNLQFCAIVGANG
jgi:hypothetical protein